MIIYRQPRNKLEMGDFIEITKTVIDSGNYGEEIIQNCYLESIILAVDDEIVVGGVAFMDHEMYQDIWDFFPSDLGDVVVNPPELGYISYIAVSLPYQGLGIGSELLKRALVRLENDGCGGFWVHVWSGSPNNASYRLFSSCGFEEVKCLERPWANDPHVKCAVCEGSCQCDCLVMFKPMQTNDLDR